MSEIEQIRIGEWVNREEHLIASKLFQARTKMGIDRGELAFLAGITESELVKYENAIEAIPVSTLLVLAKAMGVSVEYFYDDDVEIFGITAPANNEKELLDA